LIIFLKAPSDIQPGTVLTKESDIIATITDARPEISIEYNLDTVSESKYLLETYPDNSVKLVYNGPGGEQTGQDVITIKVSEDCSCIYLGTSV
jgi:hypothetical protein